MEEERSICIIGTRIKCNIGEMSLDITVWNANYSSFLFRGGREREREIFFQSINREYVYKGKNLHRVSLSFVRSEITSLFDFSNFDRYSRLSKKEQIREKKKRKLPSITKIIQVISGRGKIPINELEIKISRRGELFIRPSKKSSSS